MRTIRFEDTDKTWATAPRGAILGEEVVDDRGDIWVLCQAAEALVYGEVVQQQLNWLNGTITTAAAAGTFLLVDTANFASVTTADVRGAFGNTKGTFANGGNQFFRVREKIDDDTLLIYCVESSSTAGVISKNSTGGWGIATTTSTTYEIWKPGRVIDATRLQAPFGVTNAIIATTSPFFYARRSGLHSCIADASDAAIARGQYVCTSISTDGWVQGPSSIATPNAAELQVRAQDEQCIVGIARTDDVSFDGLISTDLTIWRSVMSHNYVPRQTKTTA